MSIAAEAVSRPVLTFKTACFIYCHMQYEIMLCMIDNNYEFNYLLTLHVLPLHYQIGLSMRPCPTD